MSWMWGSSWCAGKGCCCCCCCSLPCRMLLRFSSPPGAPSPLPAHREEIFATARRRKGSLPATAVPNFSRFKSEALWPKDPARNASYLRTLFTRSGRRNMELDRRLFCVNAPREIIIAKYWGGICVEGGVRRERRLWDVLLVKGKRVIIYWG